MKVEVIQCDQCGEDNHCSSFSLQLREDNRINEASDKIEYKHFVMDLCYKCAATCLQHAIDTSSPDDVVEDIIARHSGSYWE